MPIPIGFWLSCSLRCNRSVKNHLLRFLVSLAVAIVISDCNSKNLFYLRKNTTKMTEKITKMCVWGEDIAAVYEFDLERREIKRLTPLVRFSGIGRVNFVNLCVDDSEVVNSEELSILKEKINNPIMDTPQNVLFSLLKAKHEQMQVSTVSISAEDYERFLEYEKIVKELQLKIKNL